MRRRQDDWINATHILKAAGFDKVSSSPNAKTNPKEEEKEKEKPTREIPMYRWFFQGSEMVANSRPG